MADILGSSSSEPASKRQKKSSVANLSASTCDKLRTEVLHLAACDGVLLGAEGPFHHAPLALLPYPLPEPLFNQSIALAKPFNRMLDKVSRDLEWLTKTVRTTVEHDPFTRRLLEQLDTVSAEGIAQPIQLSINRSDYMIDQPSGAGGPARILQVELNTVSCSFVSLAAKMTTLHTHLLGRLAVDIDGATRAELLDGRPSLASALIPYATAGLPSNASVSGAAKAMAVAHRKYLSLYKSGVIKRTPESAFVVLMVVQATERNVIDQRGIEYTLWREEQVPMVRATLAEVKAHGSLDAHGLLTLKGGRFSSQPIEPTVVYFRAGYTPNDYHGEAEWDARLLLERSVAIKCPSLAQHLAGTKKVQQALAVDGVLEKFVSAGDASTLRLCFAALYGLEEDGGKAVEAIVKKAIANKDGYVMKPQREGGARLIFFVLSRTPHEHPTL